MSRPTPRSLPPTAVPWHELAFDSTRDALNDYIRNYLT